MATDAMVRDLIMHLCSMHGRKMTEEMVEMWILALSIYDDGRVAKAGRQTAREVPRMPSPADLIQRLPVADKEEMITYPKAVCNQCQKHTDTMKEPGEPPICRPCYTGMTGKEIKARLSKITRVMDGICAKNKFDGDFF